MKIEIESHNRGYLVTFHEQDGIHTYIYKMTEEFKMLEEISKRFLKLNVRVIDR